LKKNPLDYISSSGSGSAWIHIIGGLLDPDPYEGYGSGSRGKKTEKLQYCVVSSTIFLLIHRQLSNFILLIIQMYDITKLELTFDFQCFENH